MFLPKKAIAIFAVLFFVFPGVMAQNISFAEPDTVTHKDVLMYYVNGTLIDQYTTISTGIIIPNATNGDIMFVIKPQYSTPLDDPSAWLTSFLAYINTNAITLLAAAIIVGLLFKKG